VVGGRYHAIVVDEGQDFARGWLDSLYLMLTEPEHDVLYIFHDPEQALFRDDVVASLGLSEYVVDMNCRNTGPSIGWPRAMQRASIQPTCRARKVASPSWCRRRPAAKRSRRCARCSIG
jgi:hypothetical protein